MDYIDITLDNGVTKRMEVVTIFNLKHYKYNYIIYCEIDKSHYYLAKYLDNVENLSTDFDDDDEYEICKIIFNGVLKNGIRS